MTIRVKLFLLLLLLIVAFAASAGISSAVRAPVVGIRREQQRLTDLKEALRTETIAVDSLAASRYESQLAPVRDAIQATHEAFAAVGKLKILPKLNSSIADSVKTIERLRQVIDGNTANFNAGVTVVAEDAAILYHTGEPDSTSAVFHGIFDLSTAAFAPATDRNLGERTLRDIGTLLSGIGALRSTLLSSAKVIDGQNATIAKEIARVEARSAGVGLAIVIVLIGLTIVVALVLANRIVRSVRSIEANVAGMSDGDLTRSFQVETRDEIGRLSANLNRFIATLADSVGSVQAASAENIRMKESLIVTTEQTSASTTEIGANAHSIDRQISALDENLASTGSAVGSIAGSIKGLDEQIQEQMAMVEESTASVTEMIASIDSVTKIAERRRQASEQLVHTVTVGGEKMAATFEVVSAINESVDSIKEITGIIEALSTQTNLLAMNAAIEAAHAGDAGRGFSVVADEIRKLAEASAENSQEISKILKSIVERISEASASGEEMNSAFAEIDREVRELSQSLGEIYGNMSELRTGGDQILTAMSALSEVSVNVKGGSGSINENTRSIGAAMATVQRISAEVRSGMGEIARGIKEISDAVANVLSIAERLGAQGESLNTEITRFKTA